MPTQQKSPKTVFKNDVAERKDELQSAKTHLETLNDQDKRVTINGAQEAHSPIVIREALADYIERLEEEEKLDHLMKKSNLTLFECRTVFPFDFFPDKIFVDETKVSVILKEFFATESVHSILIKNVKDIQIQASIFFASVVIVPDVYFGDPVTVEYLHKNDAYKLRRLVQGIIVCQREGVDLTKLDVKEVREKVQKVGTAVSVT